MKQLKDLWRRAFLWRLTIYAFVFCLALAIIFLASWLHRDFPWGSVTDKSGHQDRPTAQPGSAPASPDELASISGSIPLAGHRIPLPAGTWRPLVAAGRGTSGLSGSSLPRAD
ncbi:MAG: hypothetical protein AAYR33_06680 [Acetobacteraceae bacterium]